MAIVDSGRMDYWNGIVSAFRGSFVDPAVEPPSFQNCWSWALKRWLISGGKLIVYRSPRARILRCEWLDRDGRLWHFEPLFPKRGVAGIWHAYLHKGVPRVIKRSD